MEEKKIVLELTVPEFLFIQEKVCIAERWCGYVWECEIEKSVREKLETAYQKPILSAEEYQARLNKVSELWKPKGISDFMAAAARRELHFEYEIEGEGSHDYKSGSDKT